jgi:putative transposase
MSRRPRIAPGGVVYHVCNRGSRKGPLFRSPTDYETFIRLIAQARSLRPMRIIAYCLMSNHWHLLLWPEADGQLSSFMHWLTTAHASQFRRDTETAGQGAVYQSRFSAVPIQNSHHLFVAWRYVERNPIEAGLVQQAEEWPWSSASDPCHPCARVALDVPPIPPPPLSFVNSADVPAEVDAELASGV